MPTTFKHPKTTHTLRSTKPSPTPSHPQPQITFDDDEPLGYEGTEQDHTGHPTLAPPLTVGKDSTKPSPFDALPWKKVNIGPLACDALNLDADGALLELEELDGSFWVPKSRPGGQVLSLPLRMHTPTPRNLGPPSASSSDPGSGSPPPHQIGHATPIDKVVKKKTKKDHLLTSRQSMKWSPTQKKVTKSSTEDRDPANSTQDSLEGLDWGAAAKLNHFVQVNQDTDLTTMAAYSFDETQLPEWLHINLANPLKRALHVLSFHSPTPVQKASLAISLSSQGPPRDLIAIAETGSGKTLAYGLPIINALMKPQSFPPTGTEDGDILPISALVVTPTRELCLQVKDHLLSFLKAVCVTNTSSPDSPTNPSKNLTGISVVAACGGMAIVKQRKQLEKSQSLMQPCKGGRGCILVATPGRLWDLIQSWDALAQGIRRHLDWLVIDEADRMLERGHFEELEKILTLTKRSQTKQQHWQDDWVESAILEPKQSLRTLVFSATMDKNLQINLQKHHRNLITPQVNSMQDLLDRIDFRDPSPHLIDLSPPGRMVGGLKECKLECLTKDKDIYLFQFLLRYPGRTIVFLSSISALRRLAPILTLLLPSYMIISLHSEMQQRARLRSLDKFKSTYMSVLLSTDVAARGLDIPLVDHVVHYQVPRTVDCYVHRSGRTARAGRKGVALVLIAPDEVKVWKNLIKGLDRVDDLPSPPVEHSIMEKLKKLLELAKKIDIIEHRSSKQAHNDNWTKQVAKMLEIEVEDSSTFDSEGEKRCASKASNAHVRQLKAQLKEQLSDGIILRGVVARQPKKRNRPAGNCYITDPTMMENMLKGQCHDRVLGLVKGLKAVQELDHVPQKRKCV